LRDCLCLTALLAAQDERLPLASTRRQAVSALYALNTRSIIRVYREVDAALHPTAPPIETTPLEGLHWALSWTAYERGSLLEAAREELDSWTWDAFAVVERVRLWQELALSEAEAFFEHQLQKHGFVGSWATDLGFVLRELRTPLSLAQWRYCTWAATRHGASFALQQRLPDPAALREAIFLELGRRARRLAEGAWPDAAFAPRQPLPVDALGQTFVRHLTRLGANFWTAAPDADALCFHAPPR
jgi:hypothetical protein